MRSFGDLLGVSPMQSPPRLPFKMLGAVSGLRANQFRTAAGLEAHGNRNSTATGVFAVAQPLPEIPGTDHFEPEKAHNTVLSDGPGCFSVLCCSRT